MANLRVDKITSTETFETTGSVQFDGSSDYLNIPDSDDLDFGSEDFTIECWILPIGDNNGGTNFNIFYNKGVDLQCYWRDNLNRVEVYADSNGDGDYDILNSLSTPTDSVNRGVWTHVAIVRSGDTFQIYLDGKASGSPKTSSSAIGSNSFDATIGDYKPDLTRYEFNGHISNVRVVKGTALYTSNFKPPMRELEVVPGTVLLACQSKTDATLEKTGKTLTVGGNAVASELTPGLLTPVPKVGAGSAITGSVEFDGTGDYLSLSDSDDFNFGSEDFTVEAWITGANGGNRISSVVLNQSILSASSNSAFYFGAGTNGTSLYLSTSGNSWTDNIEGSGTVDDGSWHHVVWQRNGNSIEIYLNGVLDVSGSFSGTVYNSTRDVQIGIQNTAGNSDFKGHISNLRVVKGTALYTEDFIPPTRELKKVPGTVLLCCQDPDNPLTEATGKTITGYGSLQQDSPELVTDGEFESASNWSSAASDWTVGSGQAVINSSNSGYDFLGQLATGLLNGEQYELVFSVTNYSTGRLELSQSGAGNIGVESPNGRNVFRFTYTGTAGGSVGLYSYTANTASFTLTNVSLKRVFASRSGSNFTPQVGDDRKVTFEGVTKINTENYFYLPTGDTASRETTGTYNAGTRGIFCGGGAPGSANSNRIEYITIASLGDTIDFGNLTVARRGGAGGCASHVRGLTGGAYTGPANNNIIDYFTITSTGNALDFGDMTGTSHNSMAVSNETRGVWMGGYTPGSGSPVNTLQYVTISSTGNAQDFGDLTRQVRGAASISSPVRGVCAGGAPSTQNTMDYITISTTGNANDFGDLTVGRDICAGGGNSKRGVIFMGRDPSMTNIIDYITIASMGNALDFGDSISSGYILSDGASSSRRVVFAGIMNPGYNTNMDFIEISTTGNAQDFGDHSTNQQFNTGLSNGHGGLG